MHIEQSTLAPHPGLPGTASGGACPRCGHLETYALSREISGEPVRVFACRRCDRHSPLVKALDRVTEELFGET